MSMDDRFNPSETPAPAKSGSGCWKWVLIFGGIGAVCMLLCCGVTGYFAYQMKPTIVSKPAEIEALAQEITDIEIPVGFTGQMGMKMNFLGMMNMTMCMFKQDEGRGMMQLTQMEMKVGDPQEGEVQLKQQMKAQGTAEMKELNVTSSETRELEIRGEQATFTISEGQDVATSTEYREVRGQFRGKAGIAVLHLQAESESLSDEAIDELLESIR